MKTIWIIWFICLIQFNLNLLAGPEGMARQDDQILSDIIDQEDDDDQEAFQDAFEQALQEASQSSTTEEAAQSFFESLLQSLMDMFGDNSDDSETEGSGSTTQSGGGNSYASGQSEHEEATNAIAQKISNDTGAPPQNYANYAGKLADTLGQLSPDALARVLGENMATMP